MTICVMPNGASNFIKANQAVLPSIRFDLIFGFGAVKVADDATTVWASTLLRFHGTVAFQQA